MDFIEQITRLAFEFGPFMFAIFVLIYLTKRANDNYAEVAARKDPPPGREELRARRLVYYLAWFSGFALILISVTWWLYGHAPTRWDFISFKVSSLRQNDVLTARDEDVYRREIFNYLSDASDSNVLEYEILVPVEGEWNPKRPIRLVYIPSDGSVREATLWASMEDARNNDVFVIEIGENGVPKLVPVSDQIP